MATIFRRFPVPYDEHQKKNLLVEVPFLSETPEFKRAYPFHDNGVISSGQPHGLWL